MRQETFGAIDIGSNAIRLLIDYIESYKDGQTEFKKAAFIRVPIRLGDDVFTHGTISQEKAERLYEAMSGFASLIKAYGVLSYKAYATSAMREASNGSEVIENIFSRSGITVETISGEKEADTIFAAGSISDLRSNYPGDLNRNYLYVDVGGGSTEIIVYSGGKKRYAESFRLGTVRIFSHAEKPEEWTRFRTRLEQISEEYAPSAIIGSGGNINKVHKMLDKKTKDAIRPKELISLYNELKDMSVERRMEEFFLNQSRAEVIVPALRIFTEVIRICSIQSVIVPRQGLADGIIRQLYKESLTLSDASSSSS